MKESLFGTLKSEFSRLGRSEGIEQLRKRPHDYIHYYSHHRLKLKLKGLSPV